MIRFHPCSNMRRLLEQRKQSNETFLQQEKDAAIAMGRNLSVTDHLNETFEDLDALHVNANKEDVERALNKYTERLKQVVDTLHKSDSKVPNTPGVLNKLSEMISKAWLVPTHGLTLGTRLCDELRKSGGLDMLISNCNNQSDEIKFSSAMLLEQCLTTDNRSYVVENGLEKVVRLAGDFTQRGKTPDHSRISTGKYGELPPPSLFFRSMIFY